MDPIQQSNSRPIGSETKKYSILVVITIFLLGLVLGASLLTYKMNDSRSLVAVVDDDNEKNEEDENNNARAPLYTNEKYGFSLDYPPNVSVVSEENIPPAGDLRGWFELFLADNQDRQRFVMRIYINHPGLGFGGLEVTSTEVIEVDNLQVTKKIMEEIQPQDGSSKMAFYTFAKGNNGYMVLANGNLATADLVIRSLEFR